jgi:unsaturated rhamnogalacturonyl hydrolase
LYSFKTKTFFILLFSFPILLLAQHNSAKQNAIHMAESIMERNPAVYNDWDYVTGTVMKGFESVWRVTDDKRFFDYIKSTLDSVVNDDGTIDDYRLEEYNIDEVNEARMLLFLYKITGEEKYKKAAMTVRKQLDGHPRISLGGFWHKQIYPWQMWLDGLYMGTPFYAEYAKMFDQQDSFKDIIKQFVLIDENLIDEKTGLYYHAWDESKQMFWADKETGLSQCFWGRGIGWYAMALVDVLDYIPQDYPGREKLIDITARLAETITKFQDETGLWWQVMDQGGRQGNYLEGTASSMFVYMLAKAVNQKWIDEKYSKTVEKGYSGLLSHLIYEDSRGQLNLLRCCQGAGLGGVYQNKIRDGSYEYYVYIESIIPNDGKGTGPFMAGSIEVDKMQKAGLVDIKINRKK